MSRGQNGFHHFHRQVISAPAHIGALDGYMPQVCSMDFDRVTGFSLDALTGEAYTCLARDKGMMLMVVPYGNSAR